MYNALKKHGVENLHHILTTSGFNEYNITSLDTNDREIMQQFYDTYDDLTPLRKLSVRTSLNNVIKEYRNSSTSKEPPKKTDPTKQDSEQDKEEGLGPTPDGRYLVQAGKWIVKVKVKNGKHVYSCICGKGFGQKRQGIGPHCARCDKYSTGLSQMIKKKSIWDESGREWKLINELNKNDLSGWPKHIGLFLYIFFSFLIYYTYVFE